MLPAAHYPACAGHTQSDDCSTAMGASGRRRPARTSPKGSALPHRASRRACAVFGNIISSEQAESVTGTPGAIIDLHVETTTSYVAVINRVALHPCNGMRDVDGVNTFGEINLKGPGDVGLTFTFKNRDTNAEVTIPWMQFTLFDFDMTSSGKGQEVPRPPPAPTPAPPTRTHGVRDPNRSAREPQDSRITRCPAGRAWSLMIALQPR
jgi:hypothetical protein